MKSVSSWFTGTHGGMSDLGRASEWNVLSLSTGSFLPGEGRERPSLQARIFNALLGTRFMSNWFKWGREILFINVPTDVLGPYNNSKWVMCEEWILSFFIILNKASWGSACLRFHSWPMLEPVYTHIFLTCLRRARGRRRLGPRTSQGGEESNRPTLLGWRGFR